MSFPVLLMGLLLDALFGEPRWLWSRMRHPAVLMGTLVGWADRTFNRNSRASGIVVTFGLVLIGGAVGLALQSLGPVAEVLTVGILLAQRSLIEHVARVSSGLRMSLPEARRNVALIVSRDSSEMQAPDIARAAIESGAENLSDGVMAPAFWALIGGLPGLVVYKLVNTADSMIGYRTPRHENFGWAAAKLDDVLNWIPARLTAALIWISCGRRATWTDIADDAKRHKSPNAGWPEAALSRGINVALAGPRRYHGNLFDLPWVHASGRKDIGAPDIDMACNRLWRVWALFVILLLILFLIF